MNVLVELKEINKDNIDEILGLKVSTEQNDFVQTTSHSLAKAWAFRDTAFPFAIYEPSLLIQNRYPYPPQRLSSIAGYDFTLADCSINFPDIICLFFHIPF